MTVKFLHTRQIRWEWGFFYLLPTLRYTWSADDRKVEFLWLTARLREL